MPAPMTSARLAAFNFGDAHRVEGDRDGFEHRGVGEGQLVRQAIEDAFRNGDVFGEGAGAAVVAAGDADDLAVVAEIDLAAPAEVAFAAVDGGVEGDAVAGPDSRLTPSADGGDDAGRLVTHDDGRNAAAGGAVVAVDVAAADAAGGDPDQHFAWTRSRRRQIGNSQMFVFGEQQSLHAWREPSRRSGYSRKPPAIAEGSVGRSPESYALKDDPQPQVLFTLGLSNLKPAASSVST